MIWSEFALIGLPEGHVDGSGGSEDHKGFHIRDSTPNEINLIKTCTKKTEGISLFTFLVNEDLYSFKMLRENFYKRWIVNYAAEVILKVNL